MTNHTYAARIALLAGASLCAITLSAGSAWAEDDASTANSTASVTVPKISVTDTATGSVRPSATTEGTGSYAADAVTVTGKEAVDWKAVPNSVAVVTRQEMNDRNAATLDDALKMATGVTVVPNDGTQSQFYSRGFGMGLMLDGTPNFSGNGASGFQQFDMGIYDRVEVLKGPAGLLQGGNESPGGTINLVRKAATRDFQYGGSQSIGSWDNYRTEGDISGPLTPSGDLRGRIVVVGQDRGFFYSPGSEVKRVGYGTLSYDITDATTVSGSAVYQHDRSHPYFGQPNYTNGTFLNAPQSFNPMAPWSTYTWDTEEENLNLEHKFDNGWVAKASATWRQQYFHFMDGYTNSGVNPNTMTTGFTERDKEYFYYWRDQDVYMQGPFHLFGQEHSLLVGANASNYNYDYRGTGNVSVGNSPIFNPAPVVVNQPNMAYTAGGKSDTMQYGPYSQLRLKVLDPLTLVGGARMTNYSSRSKGAAPGTPSNWSQGAKTTKEVTPYFGAIYDVTKNIAVYGSYSDIFIPVTNLSANGQVLPPEQGQQYETGIKTEWLGGKLHASSALFQISMVNVPYLDPANTNYYLSNGEYNSKGWEAEITGNPMPNLDLIAGYTYLIDQRTTASSNQGSQTDVWEPKHQLKLWALYHFKDGPLTNLSAGGGMRAQTMIHGNGSQTSLNQDAYSVFDAQIGYNFDEKTSVTLTGNNIFDTKYYARIQGPGTYNMYGEPANVMLTFRKAM